MWIRATINRPRFTMKFSMGHGLSLGFFSLSFWVNLAFRFLPVGRLL